MKIPDPIFDGKVIQGGPEGAGDLRGKVIQWAPGDKEAMRRWIQTFKIETRLEIIIRKRRKKRTTEQNAYYFGVVLPILADHFGYDDIMQLHDDLKLKFNPIESKIEPGRIVGGTTTKMSTEEFMASETSYVEQICRWAAMEHQIYIPPPKKKEKEK